LQNLITNPQLSTQPASLLKKPKRKMKKKWRVKMSIKSSEAENNFSKFTKKRITREMLHSLLKRTQYPRKSSSNGIKHRMKILSRLLAICSNLEMKLVRANLSFRKLKQLQALLVRLLMVLNNLSYLKIRLRMTHQL
jgi:hypothetical protein